MPAPKWSRRRWLAESIGSDLADVEEYQPGRARREGRLPLFECGGLSFVQLPTDPAEVVERTREGRQWKPMASWRDPSVTIWNEVNP